MKYRWIAYILLLLAIPAIAFYLHLSHDKGKRAHDPDSCVCAGTVDCSRYKNHECCEHQPDDM